MDSRNNNNFHFSEPEFHWTGSLWRCKIHNMKLKFICEEYGPTKDTAKELCEKKMHICLGLDNFINKTAPETNKYNTKNFVANALIRNHLGININTKPDIRELSTVQKHYENIRHDENDSDVDSEYEVSKNDLNRVMEHFKFPRNVLHNIAVKVKNHTHQDMLREPLYRINPNKEWSCVSIINWPEGLKFVGYGRTKQDAANNSAVKVLHYLLKTDKLTSKGEPNFYSKAEKQKLLRPDPVNISLPDSIMSEIRRINKKYNDVIVDVLTAVREEESKRIQEGLEPDLYFTKWDLDREVPNHRIKRRNDLLQYRAENMYDKHKSVRDNFPIYKYRDEFLELLHNSNVVVVKGEPGCGKSTQIPQYIMEEASLNGKGAKCNILITQPRRISAVSLAHRIAEERGERIGDVVGYHIRLKTLTPERDGGNILFCSTGIALRRIQSDPALEQCSHIIIDEAHERDVGTDTLLLLVKRALEINPHLKVIIMSATINADLFVNYFNNNCGALHVPGFTYPVQMNFLEDITALHLPKTKQSSLSDVSKIHEEEIAKVVNWIHKTKPPGAILCFLPGWAEILNVQKHLEGFSDPDLQILQAHSKLSTDEQRRIFDTPRNKRKVILSTNICETSITINDVVYVVDSGMHKDKGIMPSGLECIECRWVSRASVNQRKGRAGRVRPGESFHLFTKSHYRNMTEFPIPEILRVSLEKIILDSKIYCQNECALDYLSEMPEPPPSQRIAQALDELEQMSAIDIHENLTPLGRRIALFSLPPKLSKALIHSAVFKCIHPMLTICTLYSTEIELFSRLRGVRKDNGMIKQKFNKTSDHIAMSRLYDCWESSRRSCTELQVNPDRMNQIKQLREVHADNLYSCRILSEDDYHNDSDADCNEHSSNYELVKAILMSGTDTVLQHCTHKVEKGVIKKASILKNEYGQLAELTSDSVLHNYKELPSPFLCYISEMHSIERRKSIVSEASLLSPLTVLLFSDTAIESVTDLDGKRNNTNDLKIITLFGKRIQLACDKSQVNDLLELRIVIWNVLQYFIERQGNEMNMQNMEVMTAYRNELIIFLSKLLNHIKPNK